MKIYNLKDHIKGDTYTFPTMKLDINGVNQDISLYEIRMQIRKAANKTSPVMVEFSTEDETIERLSPTTDGKFKLVDRVIDIPVATYKFDMEFVKDEIVKTWVKGQIKILEEVTQ